MFGLQGMWAECINADNWKLSSLGFKIRVINAVLYKSETWWNSLTLQNEREKLLPQAWWGACLVKVSFKNLKMQSCYRTEITASSKS